MKPCSQAYCPNAAGPSGVCDECQGERRKPIKYDAGGKLPSGSNILELPPGVSLLRNKTGKAIEIKSFAAWKQDNP